MIYLNLLLIAVIVVFVVDLSGFTDAWKNALARLFNAKTVKPLRPFDCSLCLTWWTCLIYALVTGAVSIPVIAYIALLSYLSLPLGQVLIFIREAIAWAIRKMTWYE